MKKLLYTLLLVPFVLLVGCSTVEQKPSGPEVILTDGNYQYKQISEAKLLDKTWNRWEYAQYERLDTGDLYTLALDSMNPDGTPNSDTPSFVRIGKPD